MLRQIIAFSVERRAHSKIKDYLLCLASAILLIISFPFSFSGLSFWLSAWFGFVPLFFALWNKNKFKAFLLAYLTGVIFWAGAIYWLVHVTLAGTIVFVLYLALYFGVFGMFIAGSKKLGVGSKIFIVPSVWVILEYVRSHLFTGFPWALLGYSQYKNLPVIQIADITGVWGVSFLIMVINIVIYLVWNRELGARSKKKYFFLLLFLMLAICLSYGFLKLNSSLPTPSSQLLRVSVIQGNIPQELKWAAGSEDYIMEKYLDLTRQAAAKKPEIIIWPEASLPVVLEENPAYFEKVKDLTKEINIPLLLGAVTQRAGFYYNSALLVSGQGEVLNRYDKLHLVPFGEYIPLKKTFPFLETIAPIGDIESGREYTVFNYSLIKFSTLICFEDLFPELSREFVRRGAGFLVNITNDAWYKKTSAPFQHLQASVFRAIENRVYLARSANTGISGFIKPSGELFFKVQDEFSKSIFVDGYTLANISISQKPLTFYTRYGDFFIFICVFLLLLGML